jgi:transposase-like protein
MLTFVIPIGSITFMSLQLLYKRFPSQSTCLTYLEEIRWNNKPVCPYCKSTYHSALSKESRYHCNTCNTSFSVSVGTLFHNTKCDLQKWFFAISKVHEGASKLSARQLANDILVTKDTANSMIQKIRNTKAEDKSLLEGIVNAYKNITNR